MNYYFYTNCYTFTLYDVDSLDNEISLIHNIEQDVAPYYFTAYDIIHTMNYNRSCGPDIDFQEWVDVGKHNYIKCENFEQFKASSLL